MNGKLLKKVRLSTSRFTVDNGQLEEQVDSGPILNRRNIARFYRRDLHVLLLEATDDLSVGDKLQLRAMQAVKGDPAAE